MRERLNFEFLLKSPFKACKAQLQFTLELSLLAFTREANAGSCH
jgi:hypothetical protein